LLAVGAPVVLLNEAVVKIDGKPAERFAARFYRWGPQALDIADPAWQQTTFATKAVGRMPIAIRNGLRSAILWVAGPDRGRAHWQRRSHTHMGSAHALRRRTQVGCSRLVHQECPGRQQPTWMADGVDVPLNEESERYEVDVMNGANIVQTIAATTPTASYSAAQQMADFGSAQNALSVRVYQLSASVGRGWPGATTI
jgi:hypothetical protein